MSVLVIIVPGTESSQDWQDAQCDQKSEDKQEQGERKGVLIDILCQIRLETQMISIAVVLY